MAPPIHRQIRSEELWPQLRGLAQQLWHAGLTNDRLHQVWSADVQVTCQACANRLGPEELLAILDLPEGTVPSAPRLVRLSQGYCPNPACDSRFHRLTLTPSEGVDWTALLAAPESSPAETGVAPADTSAAVRHPVSRNWRRIAGIVFILIAVILARHWYLHGRLPFGGARFKVAPTTTVPESIDAPATPPSGPRTNSFRIAP